MRTVKRVLASKGLRVAFVAAMLSLVSGIAFGSPAAHSGSGVCNGFVASDPSLDASGQPGPAFIDGTRHDDVIVGSLGDDIIDGGPGDDVICGSDGNDDITGG